MSYLKQNFVDGQVLKAIHLNHIEDSIETMSEDMDNRANKSEVQNQIKGISDELTGMIEDVEQYAQGKQDALVSGTNIKTINNQSLLGDGNINIEGDVTKEYLQENYYDKPFINKWDTLVTQEESEDVNVVEERDISYSAIPMYCGKWVDNNDIHRRVYVVNSGIAKGNTIKVADKPANMELLIRGFGIVVGNGQTKQAMSNYDINVYVNNDGVYVVNNFTGYAERLYIVLEYTVSGGSV